MSRESHDNDKSEITASIQKKVTNKDYRLTLVETIEELGFIPSIDKENDTNAA